MSGYQRQELRSLSAGLVDAGAQALATFAASVFAARVLSLPELGLFAIFFSARLLASHLPTQLILIPVEAKLVLLPTEERSDHLLRNFRLALPLAVLGAAAVLLIQFIIPGSPETSHVVSQLAYTAALVALLHPLQEHARRLLHLAREHGSAATVSTVRMVFAFLALFGGWVLGIEHSLLPFGALAIGDLCALLVALQLARSRRESAAIYTTKELLLSGKWLMVSAMLGPAAGLVVGLLVAALAGAAALGLAEAARVLAQPVLVLALGLSVVLRPSSMEAAVESDRQRAESLSRSLRRRVLFASLAYLGLVSLPESVNPLMALIPKAFEIPGLVQISVIAAVVNAGVLLQRSELIALERTRTLSFAEAAATFGRVAVAVPSALILYWAVPLGFLISGVTKWMKFTSILRNVYAKAEEEV